MEHRKYRNTFSALLQVASVKVVEKGSSVSVEHNCAEEASLVVVLDGRFSGLIHEIEVLLRRNAKCGVINKQCAQNLCPWRVFAQFYKQ